MVIIIDYGLGNLRSVLGAFEKIGAKVKISSSHEDILNAERIVLPGVGAFGDAMRLINERKLIEPLNRAVIENKKPFLGICLGAQLIANKSYEFGEHEGLGWVDAVVKKIEPNNSQYKVPHVGWNDIKICKESPLFKDIPQGTLYYFVHSFHIACSEVSDITATTEHGETVVAAISKENIYATQFHPEKSQKYGLQLLKNFMEI